MIRIPTDDSCEVPARSVCRDKPAITVVPVLVVLLAGISTPGTAIAAAFAVSQADSVQGSPALAANVEGNRFLVVWADDRSKQSGLDIYGRVLGADGTALSPDIPLENAGRGQAFPAVASDPTSGRFLVVWTDWRNAPTVESDIYGRFVRSDGRPAGAAFPIAEQRVSQKFPAIAFDPGNRRYLVVWVDRRHDSHDTLYGRFLAADGGLVGPDFRVADSLGDQRRPSVAFDANRRRFVVLWWDAHDSAIYARFVADSLDVGAPTITVADRNDPRPTANLGVAAAPEEGRFFAVWTRQAESERHSLDGYGLLIDGALGKAIGAPLPIAAGMGREQSAVVGYDPKEKRFLVVWLERRREAETPDVRIQGRFVSLDGSLSDPFILSDPENVGPKRMPALAFSAERGHFLIIWENERNGAVSSRKIVGRTR